MNEIKPAGTNIRFLRDVTYEENITDVYCGVSHEFKKGDVVGIITAEALANHPATPVDDLKEAVKRGLVDMPEGPVQPVAI